MPLWLSILLLVVATFVIFYLSYLVVSNRRWIRLHAFIALAAAYFAAPAFKLVIKAYGFNVDAGWNDGSWTKDLLAGVALFLLFYLEYQYQKQEHSTKESESHDKYFHDFKNVVLDNVRDGIEDETITKNRNIPLVKVQAIITCMAWLEANQHKKKSRPRRPKGDNVG